ncbi:MAG: hypothetical protein WC824_15500, partial [Bacteroidota bacterium]
MLQALKITSIALILLTTAHVSFAQDSSKVDKLWSEPGEPFLLFGLLTPEEGLFERYEYGVGIGMQSSTSLLWRASIGGSSLTRYYKADSASTDWTSRQTGWLNLSVSPVWKMGSWDDVYF